MGRSGTLLVIGGHEDREHEQIILRELVARVGAGTLVVATVASEEPAQMWEQYQRVFRRLGISHLFRLDIESRQDAQSARKLKLLDRAAGVFFTGGDQVKLMTLLGDSPIRDRLHELYANGGVIAGTSAGASALSDTMVVGGGDKTSARIGGTVELSSGLGLLTDVLIDQHFAERGRVSRMLGAIAHNPRVLGIGIDEDTAVVVEQWGRRLRVIGTGAVYIFDATSMTYTNLADEARDRTLSMFHTQVHMLSQGDHFDVRTRAATSRPAEEAERRMAGGAAH
jgi:cyanophycinase